MNRISQRGAAVKSAIIFIVVLGFLSVAAIGVGGYLGYREAMAPGPLKESVIVTLAPGSSVSRIADDLEDAGVIRYAELFTAAVRLKRVENQLKAGEYKINARISIFDVVDQLIEGKSIQYFFTAPEGLTTAQIVRLIEADETLVGEVTIEVGEGRILPETYAFTRGASRDEILKRMMRAQEQLIADLWDDRAIELPISSPEEAIILASIVEKETAVADEREMVAAVFVNRLRRGMRLESDPTIIYGLTKGEPLGRGLRRSEIRGDTPYNTYVIRGLPPTPIANPGAASIAAVLNPAETDYLFFVADGSGGHAFAKTNREHERNVANWRRIENERKQTR